MKNIMIIRSNVNCGGPGSLILSTIRELLKRNYHVVLVCGGGDKVDEIRELGITCYIEKCLKVDSRKIIASFSLIRRLKQILIKENIEYVYGFNSAATLMAYIAGKCTGKKINYLNVLLGNGKYWFHKMMPFKHICMSEEHKKELVENGIRPNNIIVNYPSTLDEEVFKENVTGKFRDSLNLSEEDILIGTVMNGFKGNKKMMDIVKNTIENHSNVQFVFVGNTDRYLIYKNELSGFSFQNKVHFLGVRNDIPDIMDGIDILLHILDDDEGIETFGMVLTEAMIMKSAVIASDNGGMKEIVKNNVTGYLVHNNEELKDSIEKLVSDKNLREEMGKAGQQRARELFTIQRHVDILEKLLSHN
ncbi:MAG: glycosyltransferase family 4 protein [Lachnospiraceae bacterium]